MNGTQKSAIVAGGVAAAFLAASLAYVTFMGPRGDARFDDCRESNVAGGGTIGGPFTLVDENGNTVTEKDVLDIPALVYFGYTYCPDVCPFDTARNAEAVEIMENAGVMVRPIFISIDPERDTPEVMAEYTDYLHPRMLGLTGTPEQIKAAAAAYRTYYKKQDADDPEFYLVDHMTFTYLMLPETGFVEFFRRETTPEEMARRTMCFIDAAG